jgi:O-methyltransferase involved in polyketide biosynthesis
VASSRATYRDPGLPLDACAGLFPESPPEQQSRPGSPALPSSEVQEPAGELSGTAFVVNHSRALQVDISRDIYASLWVTDETKRLWHELATQVYPYDDVSSSLRNRFYLERLMQFVQNHEHAAFINLGAGFSSYPFLLERACPCAEIDLKQILDYKRERIERWQRESVLPQRTIEFLAADLTSDVDQERVNQALGRWCKNHTSFILMEGLTYYLSRPVLQRVFESFRRYQSPDSVVAFEYWTPDAGAYPVFVRLTEYLARNFGQTRPDYTLLDVSFVRSIVGYELRANTDIAEQEIAYSATRVLQDPKHRLPIHFAVLRRT